MSPAVPVRVNVAVLPEHTAGPAATVAVGNGLTVTVAVAVSGAEQVDAGLFTDTRLIVWLAVAFGTVTVAVPPAPIVAVALAPPPIL